MSDLKNTLNDSIYEEFISQLSFENITKFRKDCLLNYHDLFSKINDLLIPKQVYFTAMNNVFNDSPSDNTLYTLLFDRFKSLECKIESSNPKSEAYSLKEIASTEEIDLYNITCAFTAFSKHCFKDKMEFLFNITDLDDDGLINEREIIKIIFSVNFLFCKEDSHLNSESRLIYQSLGSIKTNRTYQMLMKYPGDLASILATEHFISFEKFQTAIEKIDKFKYEIIPFFTNLKQCLLNSRTEKHYHLKKSISEEFISISSDLIPSASLASQGDIKKKTVEFKTFSKKIQMKKWKENSVKKAEMNKFNQTANHIRKVDYSKLIKLDVPPAQIKVISNSEYKQIRSKHKDYLPRVGSHGTFRLNKGKDIISNITQLKTYGDITNEINNILLKHSNEGKYITNIVKIKNRLHSDAAQIKCFLKGKKNYSNLKFSVLYSYMMKKEAK